MDLQVQVLNNFGAAWWSRFHAHKRNPALVFQRLEVIVQRFADNWFLYQAASGETFLRNTSKKPKI